MKKKIQLFSTKEFWGKLLQDWQIEDGNNKK